jgi:hypothetical protein
MDSNGSVFGTPKGDNAPRKPPPILASAMGTAKKSVSTENRFNVREQRFPPIYDSIRATRARLANGMVLWGGLVPMVGWSVPHGERTRVSWWPGTTGNLQFKILTIRRQKGMSPQVSLSAILNASCEVWDTPTRTALAQGCPPCYR